MKALSEKEVEHWADPFWEAQLCGEIKEGDWQRIVHTMQEFHRVKRKSLNRRKALRSLLKAYDNLSARLFRQSEAKTQRIMLEEKLEACQQDRARLAELGRKP